MRYVMVDGQNDGAVGVADLLTAGLRILARLIAQDIQEEKGSKKPSGDQYPVTDQRVCHNVAG